MAATWLVDFSGTTTWLEAQQFFDENYPAGELRYYRKSADLSELGDDAIERVAKSAMTQPSSLTITDIWHVGGAMRRIDENATAFGGRQASLLFEVEADWENPKDDEMSLTWARALFEAMNQFSDGSRYFNFPGIDQEGDTVIQNTFGSKHK